MANNEGKQVSYGDAGFKDTPNACQLRPGVAQDRVSPTPAGVCTGSELAFLRHFCLIRLILPNVGIESDCGLGKKARPNPLPVSLNLFSAFYVGGGARVFSPRDGGGMKLKESQGFFYRDPTHHHQSAFQH